MKSFECKPPFTIPASDGSIKPWNQTIESLPGFFNRSHRVRPEDNRVEAQTALNNLLAHPTKWDIRECRRSVSSSDI